MLSIIYVISFLFLLTREKFASLHSFACPDLGIKCDAYPGRLNQVSFLIKDKQLSTVDVQKFVVFYTVLCP